MRDTIATFAAAVTAADHAAEPSDSAWQWHRMAQAAGEAAARMALSAALMDLPGKHATGSGGAVASSSPHATRAALRILADGGNAVDAAVAAGVALMVADVVNASIAGRAQVLVGLADGTRAAVDGATRVPEATPPLAAAESRTGFAVAPVPGGVPAILEAHRRWGRLPLADVLHPAALLARDGFVVPAHLGALWREKGLGLLRNPGARALFLKDDGSPYRAGEVFRNPALADTLAILAKEGGAAFRRGPLVDSWAESCRDGGGFLTAADFVKDGTLAGETTTFRLPGGTLTTVGRQGWGHTLIEILALVAALELNTGWPDADSPALLALSVFRAFEDRPQAIGTLSPKPEGLPLPRLVDPAFIRERAEAVRAMAAWPRERLARALGAAAATEGGTDRDTTHLSVIDGDGNAVALTTSIGPHFGAAVASRATGVLFAHSYRMASSPEAGARDWTEMSPSLVFRDDGGVLAIGAAGSERIPAAIAQVLFHHLHRKLPLAEALAQPRLSWKHGNLRLHCDFGAERGETLAKRGFPVRFTGRNHENHVGVVQAVARNPDRTVEAAADPAYDGFAAVTGPAA